MVVSRVPCGVGQFDGKNISQLKQCQKDEMEKKATPAIAFWQEWLVFLIALWCITVLKN